MSERLSLLRKHVDPNSPYAKFAGNQESDLQMTAQSGIKDMENERRKAAFDPRLMNIFIHGGEDNAKLRERMMLEFERDPTFRIDNIHDMTRPEIREQIMTRLRSVAKFVNTESASDFTTRLNTLILVDPGFCTRLSVHYGLFCNTILNQGTPEQVQYWLKKGMMDFSGMVGCFAMTEIGHGSNVAGLETTATYDRDNDDFVIHSPTTTSTKFWIGGAAESATHSTVFANLMVDGKNYGVKPFVVQLRDPESFTLLPGINIGDCGAKMGRNGIDNGWISFTFVRIPRTNMLMKYTKVSRDGKVSEPAIAQLAYGALIFGRTSIIRESADMAKKALVIAIRYAVVRKQFAFTPGQPEKAIMDYQTHQYKLINLLAATYAMQITGLQVRQFYESLMKDLETINPSSAKMATTLATLKEVHATSAGLKAMCTWKTLDLIEQCRQSCGGYGYLSYTNLSAMYQDHAVQCTWEGDNTVLTLQTGRYLVGCLRDLKKGKTLPAGVSYLNGVPSILKKTCNSSDVGNLNVIQEAFNCTCANLVLQAGKLVESVLAQGKNQDEALEKSSSSRFLAAKLHCYNQLFNIFCLAIPKAEPSLRPHLTALCALFGLNTIIENAGSFLQFGYFKPHHIPLIEAKIAELLETIRPHIIPLTDAFGLSDYVINSPLGCYDGDVYRRLMDRVTQSNPQKPHPYFERIIKPVLLRTKKDTEIVPFKE